MKKSLINTNQLSKLLFTCALASISFLQNSFSQQISIDNSQTPQQLIENNLILGCVEVSNIVSNVNGSVNGLTSYGYFEKGTSNFPFENGILLSTGNSVSAGNATNANNMHDGDENWATDPDIETALGISNTVNATSIELKKKNQLPTTQFMTKLKKKVFWREQSDASTTDEMFSGQRFAILQCFLVVRFLNHALTHIMRAFNFRQSILALSSCFSFFFTPPVF